RRREGRRLLEGVQRGEIGLQREARLAEEERGVGNMRVLRISLDQPLELSSSEGVEAVLKGALAHRPEPLGLVRRCGDRGQAGEKAETEAQAVKEPGAPTPHAAQASTKTKTRTGADSPPAALDRSLNNGLMS